jgi:hypothetical protein
LASRLVMLLGNIVSISFAIAGILQALSWTIAGATILAILSITTLAPTRQGSRSSIGHSSAKKMGHSTVVETKPIREKLQEKQAARPHQTPTKEESRVSKDELARMIPQSRSDSERVVPPKIIPPKTIPTTVSPAKSVQTKSASAKQEAVRPAPVGTVVTMASASKPAQARIDPNTRLITKGDYATYDVELGPRMGVTCDITASGPVNVYLMDSDNLNSLDLGEEFWSETGEEGVQKATLHFVAPQNGKWFLVVENLDNEQVSATANIRKTSAKTSSTA